MAPVDPLARSGRKEQPSLVRCAGELLLSEEAERQRPDVDGPPASARFRLRPTRGIRLRGDRHGTRIEVDVALAQSEQLTLAAQGQNRDRNDAADVLAGIHDRELRPPPPR